MHQIYRRTHMPECDFNKVAKNTFSLKHLWVAASGIRIFSEEHLA